MDPSAFDVFFGGNATVLNPHSTPEEVAQALGAALPGNNGVEVFSTTCGGAIGRKPEGVSDLVIPTEQRADPSDAKETMHVHEASESEVLPEGIPQNI